MFQAAPYRCSKRCIQALVSELWNFAADAIAKK
jgi:hypothetical protein